MQIHSFHHIELEHFNSALFLPDCTYNKRLQSL
jgi:hypothetical protein